METKNLMYRVELRFYGEFVNNGVICVRFEDKKLKCIEGILTCDYVKFLIDESSEYIIMHYYEPDDKFKKYELSFKLKMKIEDFVLPFQIFTNSFEFKMMEAIEEIEEQQNCLNRLQEMKNLFSWEESAM